MFYDFRFIAILAIGMLPIVLASRSTGSLNSIETTGVYDYLFTDKSFLATLKKKHGITIGTVIPKGDSDASDGLYQITATFKPSVMKRKKDILLTCGSSKNRVIQIYNDLTQPSRQVDPVAIKFQIPILSFPIGEGDTCYATWVQCDLKLKHIHYMFLGKPLQQYKPILDKIETDIIRGALYLRKLGWIYNLDLGGEFLSLIIYKVALMVFLYVVLGGFVNTYRRSYFDHRWKIDYINQVTPYLLSKLYESKYLGETKADIERKAQHDSRTSTSKY
ncbi:hypothetical protein BDF22DRAFT_691710 [Syncephalis plumigaleata]|nr:hypothetical protein BDF22DRAFT_691710 [Syncephalis plumigaleata]